ncbi:Arm DNA-binding domain-containing protein [Pedobacter sp. P26]|uniref:Arm DNA-binding domain-containing protein n=1 Tax=Pedobacter sp. P26 TaxID=3423956 RepID=UPI003D671CB2
MKTNFSLLFYLKKQKNYVSGNVPIYMRITVEGNRAEMATNRDCDPKRWNAKGSRAIGSKEEIKALNTHLDHLQNAIYYAHQRVFDMGLPITVYFNQSDPSVSGQTGHQFDYRMMHI